MCITIKNNAVVFYLLNDLMNNCNKYLSRIMSETVSKTNTKLRTVAYLGS